LPFITLSDSVEVPWTRDRPVANTCKWQHTVFTRDKQSRPRRDSNPQFQKASGRRPMP